MSSLIHQRWIVNEHSASDFMRFAVALVAALVFYVRGQAQSGTTPGTQPPGTQPPGTIAIDAAEVRGHRILPEKAIHADLTFQELFSGGTVTLSVVVNPYGRWSPRML
jgi:hypothetical protein